MTTEDVRALFNEFSTHVDTEREYKEELLRLRLSGNDFNLDELNTQLLRHDELILAIEKNRNESILPIVETLIKFIAGDARNHDVCAN